MAPRGATGRGAINPAGLDFYDRLVDELCRNGICPVVTLYHWDLPQALEDLGGWVNRETAKWFGEFAALVARKLSDRVFLWITLNEPLAVVLAGYLMGIHPPGRQDPALALQVSHHFNLAHRLAVLALRAAAPTGRVGITHVSMPVYPATASEADQLAARRCDNFVNRWFWEPSLRGAYPQEAWRDLADLTPHIEPADLDELGPPIDFFAHNSYTRIVVRDEPSVPILRAVPVRQEGRPHTDMDWEVYPQHLSDALVRIHRDYGPIDIYITENGAAYPDRLGNGRVHDTQRIAYLRDHLCEAARAITLGVPLRGYFC